MPRGDGTGPMGYGPMSGRGMGFCAGYNVPGCMNGHGFGMHRGYRHMFYATGVPGYARFGNAKDEKSYLKAQAQYLEDQLKYIKDRLNDLEDTNDDDKKKE
ncbi:MULTISPECIES: DUF5320 domain-containing protein [Thermoanaerobacterium]|jgi:hypothetical protein|uniref:DUF5320 domain-containing protein n=1 Tax=Thermoanaerobacterium butyriciformans TaxID=1702242 RepID=A0ABS4NE59_9THEO|nr:MULTISPECIES: DUF5320 domain-containing protein [Thermoanaerobacterium]MBP2071479.1 hypothetical protein [Thermoanaerobacterium butyriciformans]MDK2806194.1 hypothetical protein [Thermoanaerobacterium sp.]WHE06490.1 DUF5320 domain-containing protein [Thermoanaerobacterium thermosaccharolyticum]WKV09637.1 DUF5320 domain-containing protein [Thermoanaerobacterium sp. CMT5567-10]